MKPSSTWSRIIYLLTASTILFVIAMALSAQGDDPEMKVMRTGLGSGTIASADGRINCGADCNENYAGSDMVTLTATAAAGSTFGEWSGDCSGPSNTCGPLSMSAARSVRAKFNLSAAIPRISIFNRTTSTASTRVFGPTDFLANDEVIRPEDIETYLTTNTGVNSAPRFLAALVPEFKQNWILMTRSESLQTGTAQSPRILLPSRDGRFVFTVGMTEHSAYPGAHPNAIEYMQWDPDQKNFRFHEIVLDNIPAMTVHLPDGSTRPGLPARSRGISKDDAKCPKCHSTRNVLNRTSLPGTDGIPPGSVPAKNKPNWDSYDSWAGMMPFNRDRIYQGSVEAAAFRTLLNPWTWTTNDTVRAIMEQLDLQPAGILPQDVITRTNGGANDGHINFPFDAGTVLIEPSPSPASPADPSINTSYSFNGVVGTGATSPVIRGGSFITLRHSAIPTQGDGEGRGVRFFDNLGGLAPSRLNQQRIADELVRHTVATGNVPIDIRPIAMAISKGTCLNINTTTNVVERATGSLPALTVDQAFFTARHGGLNITQVLADTMTRFAAGVPATRSTAFPRRKADIAKLNLDRTGDPYLFTPENGLIQQYGGATSAGATPSLAILRQEAFRRPTNACPGIFCPDSSEMGGIYVDREDYTFNTNRIALYRYFLEPLGVSVDKWSMGVRGRSRTYTFADVFSTYGNVIEPALSASLLDPARSVPGLTNPNDCGQLINAINLTLGSLPAPDAVPFYTDVQRIFNKSCIECHGGLDYPPYATYGTLLNLSENDAPPAGESPLVRPHGIAASRSTSLTAPIYRFITRTGENCPPGATGMMPCGGPPLSQSDIDTVRRWINGGHPYSEGDPHLKTIDGTNYDFQSAGEFVLLRDDIFEVQTRQSGVETDGPLGPNGHTGLSSCVSLNTAAAVRVGPHRVTYQPDTSRTGDGGMQLRIDGKLTSFDGPEIRLPSGGRIVRTQAQGGIQIESTDGTIVVMTSNFWNHYRVWYLNVDINRARATQGVMGAIPPGNWLPALPDGSFMGPRPEDLHQRYVALYEKFEDAWRVTDATSLFDYAPGTSTSTFTIKNWPEENPRSCVLPREAPGKTDKAPLKALPVETAQQHCNNIVDAARKANCIQDVMVTGETGFANAYLLTEQIGGNKPPDPPNLDLPVDRGEIGYPVTFTWGQSKDADNTGLTYRQCVWAIDKNFTWNDCDPIPIQATTSWRGGIFYALLVSLIAILLFALLVFLGLGKKPVLLSLLAVLILVGVVIAFRFSSTNMSGSMLTKTVSRTNAGSALESGKSYFWKVVVEDGRGASAESETRRFVAK
jgi:hypothetical protein